MSELGDGASIVVKSQMQVGPGLESQVLLLSAGSVFLCTGCTLYKGASWS